jgi:hypothetical protein
MRRHLAGVALALTVLLAGCGQQRKGDGVASAAGGGATPSASASATTDPDQARKFAQCMRENGVPDFPDPGPDGQFDPSQMRTSGLDMQKLQKGMSACRDLAPNGGQNTQLDAQQQEQLRQFAQCMRDNGVDMADPDPNGGGLGPGGAGLNTSDPAFQKAMEACQDKLASIIPGSGR